MDEELLDRLETTYRTAVYHLVTGRHELRERLGAALAGFDPVLLANLEGSVHHHNFARFLAARSRLDSMTDQEHVKCAADLWEIETALVGGGGF
jgi:hypothetical protein